MTSNSESSVVASRWGSNWLGTPTTPNVLDALGDSQPPRHRDTPLPWSGCIGDSSNGAPSSVRDGLSSEPVSGCGSAYDTSESSSHRGTTQASGWAKCPTGPVYAVEAPVISNGDGWGH